MKGRKRRPKALKVLDGTYRKDRDNNAPVFTLVSMTEPPEHLSNRAKKEWILVTSELIRLGVLQTVDVALLAAYCQEIAEYWRCQLSLSKARTFNKGGRSFIKPEVAMANNALKNAMVLATKFGFTPVDREKLTSRNTPQKKSLSDVLELS